MTGIPLILNTSFNRGEPIVTRPQEAISCYLRTEMDVLVLGDFYVTGRDRDQGTAWPGEDAMNNNIVETAQIQDTLKALEPSKPTELAVETGLDVLASLNRYAPLASLQRNTSRC